MVQSKEKGHVLNFTDTFFGLSWFFFDSTAVIFLQMTIYAKIKNDLRKRIEFLEFDVLKQCLLFRNRSKTRNQTNVKNLKEKHSPVLCCVIVRLTAESHAFEQIEYKSAPVMSSFSSSAIDLMVKCSANVNLKTILLYRIEICLSNNTSSIRTRYKLF